MNEIFTRRSVRKYADKPVEKEKVEKLLRRAMQAPSATNQQPWEFIVVDDKELLKKLSSFSPYSKFVADAPLAMVLLNRTGLRAQGHVPQDMGACMENLLLQAVELDLGAVWMGAGLGDERDRNITKIFDLPENVKPFGVVSIGYPAEENANKFVERYDESRVHYNKY